MQFPNFSIFSYRFWFLFFLLDTFAIHKMFQTITAKPTVVNTGLPNLLLVAIATQRAGITVPIIVQITTRYRAFATNSGVVMFTKCTHKKVVHRDTVVLVVNAVANDTVNATIP